MGITRKVLNFYAKLSPGRGRVLPPYKHVVQIGDPTLRKLSKPVPVEKIKTEEVQILIKKLESVLYSYGSVGMSAPQIGVNLRIFVMMVTQNHINTFPKEIIKSRGMTPLPYTVFINPQMKIIDYRKIVQSEGCESVRGFSADVTRYKEVEITGYSKEAELHTKVFKDWSSRIAQHELDHLDGKLYTDVMDKKTLHCTCWEEVNLSQGKVALPFFPE